MKLDSTNQRTAVHTAINLPSVHSRPQNGTSESMDYIEYSLHFFDSYHLAVFRESSAIQHQHPYSAHKVKSVKTTTYGYFSTAPSIKSPCDTNYASLTSNNDKYKMINY